MPEPDYETLKERCDEIVYADVDETAFTVSPYVELAVRERGLPSVLRQLAEVAERAGDVAERD